MKFNDKLRLLAEYRGINQADVRRHTKAVRAKSVSNSTVSNWFSGLYMPDADYALAIARLFGVPMEFLLDDSKSFDDILRHLRGDDMPRPQKLVFQLAEMFGWEVVAQSLVRIIRPPADLPAEPPMTVTTVGPARPAEVPEGRAVGRPKKKGNG